MNKMYDTGEYSALTSYRNSQNFCANWISAGYALWFLRESRFLNRPRTRLGVNCAVSGTGFLISADVLPRGRRLELSSADRGYRVLHRQCGARPHVSATAAMPSSTTSSRSSSVSRGISVCAGARASIRWTQSIPAHCCAAVRAAAGAGMSCYDMLMTVAPCNLVHHRLAAAGRTSVRDQLRTAGIHYIPRYAHARPYSDADRARHYVQPVCLFGAVTMIGRVEAHRRSGVEKGAVYLHVPALHAHLRSDLDRRSGRQGRVEADPAWHCQGAGGARERVMPPRGWARGRGLGFPSSLDLLPFPC